MQYKKEKDILILPKIRKTKNKNKELNSPLEKYARKNNLKESLQVKLLSFVIFSCSIYFTFSSSKLSFIFVMTQTKKEIKTISSKLSFIFVMTQTKKEIKTITQNIIEIKRIIL